MQSLLNRVPILLLASALLLATLMSCQKNESAAPAPAAPAEKASAPASEPAGCSDCVPVTPDNFVRAESDKYFALTVQQAGGIGKFHHDRESAPVDKQLVVRGNLDTLYSTGIWDLDAGPVTVTLPEAGKRFRSLMPITEDQYVPAVYYNAGKYTFTREKIGTRYLFLAIRTLIDPNDPKDIEQAHALQDATKTEQKSSGEFEVPKWDPVSQKKVHDALLVLFSTLSDQKGMFGSKQEVDPVHFLIGAAALWGGNPEKAAIYLNVTPAKNDGHTIYKLTARDVPVDGFWSISVYNAQGYFQKNEYNAYSLNNVTAKKSDDGSVIVQFGSCDGKIPNCLPIVEGWNYTVRLYRPRAEILSGKWKFPEANPAS